MAKEISGTNPVLSRLARLQMDVPLDQRMTVAGTARKTAVLLGLTAYSAATAWWYAGSRPDGLNLVMGATLPAVLVAFVLALILCFKPRWTPWGAPLYAVLEGVAVGGISLLYEQRYHGIVPQAAALTLGVGLGLGILYQSRVIRVSDTFVKWVTMATFGVVLYYVVMMACSFFGVRAPAVTGSGWMSIGLSLLICGIASANYLVDFRIIEENAAAGLPKWAEWSGAFGLLITTVWLYLEILRLLGKLKK